MKNSNSKPELVTAISEYRPSKPCELTLDKGDFIKVLDKRSPKGYAGFWYGENVKGKRVGWFPASHVTQAGGKVKGAAAEFSTTKSTAPTEHHHKETQSKMSTARMKNIKLELENVMRRQIGPTTNNSIQQKAQTKPPIKIKPKTIDPINAIPKPAETADQQEDSSIYGNFDKEDAPKTCGTSLGRLVQQRLSKALAKMTPVGKIEQTEPNLVKTNEAKFAPVEEDSFDESDPIYGNVDDTDGQSNGKDSPIYEEPVDNFPQSPLYGNFDEPFEQKSSPLAPKIPSPNVQLEQTEQANPELMSEYVVAIESYSAERDGDMSIEVNDVVRILSKQYPNWWRGRNVRTGAMGLFPSKAVVVSQFAQQDRDQGNDEENGLYGNCMEQEQIYDELIYEGVYEEFGEKPDEEDNEKSEESSHFEMSRVLLAAMIESGRKSITRDELEDSVVNNYCGSQSGTSSSDAQNASTLQKSPDIEQLKLQVRTAALRAKTSDKAAETVIDILKKQSKRYNILVDIVQNEETFVGEIRFLLEHFVEPIQRSMLISSEEHYAFCSIVQQILKLHEELLQSLNTKLHCRTQGTEVPLLGSLFEQAFLSMISLYKTFCKANLCSKIDFDSRLSAELDQIAKCNQQNNLSARLLLQRPVQRITKYGLLMQSLLQSTPYTHPDYESIAVAHQAAKLLCETMNKALDKTLGEKEKKARAELCAQLEQFQKDFTADFTFALNHFVCQIQQCNMMKSNEDLFSRIFQQIYLVNFTMLEKLTKRFQHEEYSSDVCLGALLLSHYQQILPVYQSFCEGFSKWIAKVEDHQVLCIQLESILSRAQLSYKAGLLRLMQQAITKLPLVIEKLLEQYPTVHPEHHDCAQQLVLASSFCKEIDKTFDSACTKWEWGSLTKLYWVQRNILYLLDTRIENIAETAFLGSRILLHSGLLLTEANETLAAFLFNDFLLIVKSKLKLDSMHNRYSLLDNTQITATNYSTYSQLENPLLLDELRVSTGEPKCIRIDLPSIKQVLNLHTKSIDEWSCGIEQLAQAQQYYRSHSKNLVQNYQAPIKQNLVTILSLLTLEVINLYHPNYPMSVYCKYAMGKSWPQAYSVFTTDTISFPKNADDPKIQWEVNNFVNIYDLADVLHVRCYEANAFGPHQLVGEVRMPIGNCVDQSQFFDKFTKGLPMQVTTKDSKTKSVATITRCNHKRTLPIYEKRDILVKEGGIK